VLFTGEHAQVVAMALNPHEAIGEEVHAVISCSSWSTATAKPC
jgi:hypothetical protein